MGRRLNVSTPTVINTELVPLDESFYLDVDGQMEQWYYDNTEQYAPNRKVTPLLLVPVISTFDKDTSTSYTPAFNTTQWFANEWDESQGKYVETEITNQVDSGSADYVIQGNGLLVKKNVSYSHAVTIRCVATYIDPRDSGVTYTVEDSVNLTTNRNSDVVFINVAITSPSSRSFNPLVDYKDKVVDGETLAGSIFKFHGTITNENSIGAFTFIWYGIKDGNEVLANTLPWYVSGQNTDTLVVDAMYGESINVLLRAKLNDKQDLSPSKAYASLSWRTPDIEPFVQSDNGGVVRSDTKEMTFDTIVNVNGEVLSDALKRKHLAFNWKIRKSNTSTEIDKGWGQRITIDASDLRNVKGSGSTLASTLVSNDVYLKGAYEEVTYNGEVVTDGGEVVYDRPVD